MEPFHFDYWMLSLVWWMPVVDPSYPTAIMLGSYNWRSITLLADETFRCIGKALGDVKAVNLDDGKIQVVIHGQKPLCFETVVEFHGGEETVVYLRYERLFGYCRICFSLCHDHQRCPTRSGGADRTIKEDNGEDQGKNQGAASYRAAMLHGNAGNKGKGNKCRFWWITKWFIKGKIQGF
ncbi:uncharacterized protein LOC112089146 [Eutrema salsugineum]|uniref:uncharacterized protein LOC112089146 n=1 Tax=Eutrema salsugineum TaxID=72664 RepID=UPI000CED7617|nr:uncharacterized protein LOC112089146 [Eutrema salsugineum]